MKRQQKQRNPPLTWDARRMRQAKNRKKALMEAEKSRAQSRHDINTPSADKGDPDERDLQRCDRDSKYLEQHLRTIKTSLQRELNNDPLQYLERLFQELVLWKNANRPAVSPLDHPTAILQSLDHTIKKILQELRCSVLDFLLIEKFHALCIFVLHLLMCVNDLNAALLEEDLVDQVDEVTASSHYQTLEERHDMRSLKMFEGGLRYKYEVAGL
ncbi:hypothetical protein PM082_006939 [Marasmius tenuissimus]|nr:hypothetical protein PM082_006939 [Marasmius tenuissimus]